MIFVSTVALMDGTRTQTSADAEAGSLFVSNLTISQGSLLVFSVAGSEAE